MGQFFRLAWKCQARLWKVFWLAGVLPNIAFKLVVAPLASVSGLLSTLLVALYSVYGLLWMVLAWKNSWNSSSKIWGYLVRIFVSATLLLTVLGLFMLAVGLVSPVGD